jgi:transposase
MKRRSFTAKFKTKVVLEALKEKHPLSELAGKYKLHPQQIRNWKKEFLSDAASVFEKGGKKSKKGAEEEKDRLLKTIGQLKVEVDFLSDALK